MEMSSSQIVPAPLPRVWTALNDPQLLKVCITGCQAIERTAENEYKVAMAVKVGPVNAKFTGKIVLSDLIPNESYTLNFEGQGGMAGFAKGVAKVKLSPEGDATQLAYTASAQIGGKLAQIGSRLVDGAANKMATDFFAALNRELSAPPASASEAPPAEAGVAQAPPPSAPGDGAAAAPVPDSAAAETPAEDGSADDTPAPSAAPQVPAPGRPGPGAPV